MGAWGKKKAINQGKRIQMSKSNLRILIINIIAFGSRTVRIEDYFEGKGKLYTEQYMCLKKTIWFDICISIWQSFEIMRVLILERWVIGGKCWLIDINWKWDCQKKSKFNRWKHETKFFFYGLRSRTRRCYIYIVKFGVCYI